MRTPCLIAPLLLLLLSISCWATGCATPPPSASEDPSPASTAEAPASQPASTSIVTTTPVATAGIPAMPEGMLFISYYFDNPDGSPDAPILDQPLARVRPGEVRAMLPGYLFDDEAPEHLAAPVDLTYVEMQVAYPMGEAAITGKYGEEPDFPSRRAHMTCHTGVSSHGASRCCMVPPSTPSTDVPFEARTADMLWAVVCLGNNVIQ